MAGRIKSHYQGRVVVAGTFTVGGQNDLNLIRYLANGMHDTSFGTAGEVIIPGAASEQAVAIRAAGDKLLVASTAVDGGSSSLRVRRFSADGSHDTSFGAMGVAEVLGCTARDMLVLPDGRIVLLTNQSLLVRLTSTGAIDTLFGPSGAGKLSVFLGDSGVVGRIQLYSDYLIVVAGGDDGGMPGPGTFGVVARIWM
jgi:uncharacterized delta-60 repeat protein